MASGRGIGSAAFVIFDGGLTGLLFTRRVDCMNLRRIVWSSVMAVVLAVMGATGVYGHTSTVMAEGIMPVLPGYCGIVPADFATLNPGAHVVTQGDWNGFMRLTAEWPKPMRLQDELLRTSKYLLPGRWMAYVPGCASSPDELDRLNYDARLILTTWRDRHASDAGGLHQYGDKNWAGLTSDYYLPRWQMYFDSLALALESGEAPKPIDWFAFWDARSHRRTRYSAMAVGDSPAAAMAVAKNLQLVPGQVLEGSK